MTSKQNEPLAISTMPTTLELKDDYTRRTAEVIRSIEKREAALEAASSRVGWRRGVVWLVGLALLGGVSGLLLARASGARSGGEGITGGVRQSVVTRLNEARGLLGDQEQWDEAIDIYDSVLSENPSSVEALTYRGWLEYRQGAPADTALVGLVEAGRFDPDYPDAIVFNTIMLADGARYDEAADVLRRLDLTTAPAPVAGLLDERGLIGEVFGEAVYPTLIDDQEIDLETLRLTSDAALQAAGYLFSTDLEGRTVASIKLYRAVQQAEPDNAAALSREATLLALTGDPELLDRSVELANRAVAAQPENPEALVSRATVFATMDVPPDQICADVNVVLGLEDVAPALAAQAQDLAARLC